MLDIFVEYVIVCLGIQVARPVLISVENSALVTGYIGKLSF